MTNITINRATDADIDGIMELQAANQPEHGGMLSANLDRYQIKGMIHELPQIVARRGSSIVAFLMTSTREMSANIPIVRAMLAEYQGSDDSYIYGPICVKAEERGKGLAQAMFNELRRLTPGREGILLIRRDNPSSLRAHAKMGMHEVASFVFTDMDHIVLSYFG